MNKNGEVNVGAAVICGCGMGAALANNQAGVAVMEMAFVAINLFCWFMCTQGRSSL